MNNNYLGQNSISELDNSLDLVNGVPSPEKGGNLCASVDESETAGGR